MKNAIFSKFPNVPILKFYGAIPTTKTYQKIKKPDMVHFSSLESPSHPMCVACLVHCTFSAEKMSFFRQPVWCLMLIWGWHWHFKRQNFRKRDRMIQNGKRCEHFLVLQILRIISKFYFKCFNQFQISIVWPIFKLSPISNLSNYWNREYKDVI